MTIKEQIIKLFKKSNELTVKELVDKTGASKQMVHLVMARLLDEQRVEKLGRTPKTIYRFVGTNSFVKEPEPQYHLPSKENELLNESFMAVSDSGAILNGLAAFEYWCKQRKLPVKKPWMNILLLKKSIKSLKMSMVLLTEPKN